MSQLLTLIWLKWRLMRNSLRSSKAVVNKIASVLGMLLALIALGLGRFGSTSTFLGPGFEPATAEEFEDAAWATVLGLALGAGAAVLGGVLATREEISRVW